MTADAESYGGGHGKLKGESGKVCAATEQKREEVFVKFCHLTMNPRCSWYAWQLIKLVIIIPLHLYYSNTQRLQLGSGLSSASYCTNIHECTI